MSEGSVLNRWRLVLGKNAEDQLPLSPGGREMDEALEFLYSRERSEDERQERGGSEESCLTVPVWLNKVRRLFPRQAAEVLERHALERYRLSELLTDREVLEKLEPNQALLGTLLSLRHLLSDSVLDAARRIAKQVADELTRKMEREFRRSALGKLDRSTASPVRTMRNFDVKRTIRRNLRHYDREKKQLTIERAYFNGRVRKYNEWRVIIAVDESGSMADSVIHSAVMAGIFSRLPMLDTKLVIFDTQVVDLSGYAGDPVEVLMSVQLGGGTNIAGALAYCESLIVNPHRTMVILVSDLCEGGPLSALYGVCAGILESGTRLIALTALDADANPVCNHSVAQKLAELGAFVGALTPEQLGNVIGRIMQ